MTRVKSRKNKPKITVGITISPILYAEARKRNLSRILEQALESIIEYVQPQTETESSNISYSRFFS
jgi:DNA repair photolyase